MLHRHLFYGKFLLVSDLNTIPRNALIMFKDNQKNTEGSFFKELVKKCIESDWREIVVKRVEYC